MSIDLSKDSYCFYNLSQMKDSSPKGGYLEGRIVMPSQLWRPNDVTDLFIRLTIRIAKMHLYAAVL